MVSVVAAMVRMEDLAAEVPAPGHLVAEGAIPEELVNIPSVKVMKKPLAAGAVPTIREPIKITPPERTKATEK